ncbi:MAG: GntR family transcriptional regulator [Christensenella sp.]|nr:GntR family transcriptional regulator [Christensenella sp.]
MEENSSLLDSTYSHLKNMIIMGKYSPNSRLVVSKLSEELGVSHTPINEALNRLVSEGYVEFMPRRGMKVKKLTFEEIAETYEMRKMIELYCAEDMVQYAKNVPLYLEELHKCTDKQNATGYQATAENDMESFFKYEAYFHQLLLSATGNKQMFTLYRNLKSNGMFYYMMQSTHHKLSKTRYLQTMKEHEDILKAMEDGNVRRLKTLLTRHLERSQANLVQTIKTEKEHDISPFIQSLRMRKNEK